MAISHEVMPIICFCICPAPFFDRGKLFFVSSAPLSPFLILTWRGLFLYLTSELQTASVFSTLSSVLPTVHCAVLLLSETYSAIFLPSESNIHTKPCIIIYRSALCEHHPSHWPYWIFKSCSVKKVKSSYVCRAVRKGHSLSIFLVSISTDPLYV